MIVHKQIFETLPAKTMMSVPMKKSTFTRPLFRRSLPDPSHFRGTPCYGNKFMSHCRK